MKNETIRRIWEKIKWLYGCANGFKFILGIYTVLGTISSLLGIVYALAFKQMVDIAIKNVEGSLFQMIFLIAGILLAEEIFSAVQSMINVKASQKMSNQLRQHIFQETICSQWKELERYHSGDIMNRLEGDTSTIVSFLTGVVPSIIICSIKLCVAFLTMLFLDPIVAVCSVIVLPFIILLARLLIKKLKDLNKEYRKVSSDHMAYVQETIQNTFVIKAFQAEQFKIEGLKKIQNHLLQIACRRNFISIAAGSILSVGFSAGYILAFLIGAWRMTMGLITFGTVSAFLQLISEVQDPLYSLSNVVPSMVSVSVSSERLMELLQLQKEETHMQEILPGPIQICLEHLTFGYDANERILEDVSYCFEAGKATALIGKTGEGKTTLLRLFLAFLKPQQGGIFLEAGGKKIKNDETTRNNYAYVPQGNTVFSGSLRENMIQWDKTITEEELSEAIYCACAEFVYELPQGLDTVIGEKGSGLSEGQALRIAIVRGLLRRVSIMIFDESTAALDEVTQAKVFMRIRHSYRERTLIFVTHKLSMASYCDKIVKVEGKHLYPVQKEELQEKIQRIQEEETQKQQVMSSFMKSGVRKE